jgi:hypothetical protein
MTKDDLVKFKEDLLSDFKAVFTKEKAVEVKLGMATLKDGETQIEYMGETMEVGSDVFVVNGEDRAPLPVGKYPLEDGTTLFVTEEGKIAEVKETVEEEGTEELNNDETAKAMTEDFKQLMKSLTIKYAEESKQMVTELKASFEAQLSEQNAIIEELKKTPATTAIKSAPTQLSAQPKTSRDRILNAILKNK